MAPFEDIRNIMNTIATEFGGLHIVVHCAGVLVPIAPLLEADPSTFLEGYKTTIVGTLVTAQAVVLANNKSNNDDKSKPLTFINLTTAGILFPPFPGMGAYVSSKTAAPKLLQCFATENPRGRMRHVHPGFLETEMSRHLGEKIKLPFGFDFLVWIASPEAEFLRDKIVFAACDVDELKERKNEILSEAPGNGELWLAFQGFP